MTCSGEKWTAALSRIRVVISTYHPMLEFPVCACQQLATVTGQVQFSSWKSLKYQVPIWY